MGEMLKKDAPEHLASELDKVALAEREGAFISDEKDRSTGFVSVGNGVGDSSLDELFKTTSKLQQVSPSEASLLAGIEYETATEEGEISEKRTGDING